MAPKSTEKVQTDRNPLIALLADHLQGRPSQAAMTPKLRTCARDHQVTGILYHQLRDPALEQDYYYTLYQYKNRQAIEREIGQILDADGMRYFWVKGMEVAALYPVPALRTMGDSDIVVEDVERAFRLLKQHGYTFERDVFPCEWPCYKNGLRVELQSRLAYTGSEALLVFFNTCWQHESGHHLDWSFHFIYLLEHLRKHLVHEGVGYRQFLDLAVVLQRAGDQLDWPWIRQQLQALELWRYAEVCLALVHRWFEVELPVEVPPLTDEFCAFAAERTLKNGVFGYSNPDENPTHGISLEKSESGTRAARALRRFRRTVFPSYHQLIVWSEYRFLKGRPYLLPVCWVYRLLRAALQPAKWRRLKADAAADRSLLAQKNEELRQWGL